MYFLSLEVKGYQTILASSTTQSHHPDGWLLFSVNLFLVSSTPPGVSCKGGAVFDDCVPSCQRTCENKDDPEPPCARSQCAPGCRCPAGTIWNDSKTKCIPQWMCPVQVRIMMLDVGEQRGNMRRKKEVIFGGEQKQHFTPNTKVQTMRLVK